MSTPIHHISLTVSDVDRSAAWYQALFGEADVAERQLDGGRRVRMAFASGLTLGVSQYDPNEQLAPFSHRTAGLDHFGIGCDSEAQVRKWAAKLDSLGFAHGPVEDAPYGWAVTARDPDNIPVEFFCPKA